MGGKYVDLQIKHHMVTCLSFQARASHLVVFTRDSSWKVILHNNRRRRREDVTQKIVKLLQSVNQSLTPIR